MKKALLPGSFDPITRGHIDLIARASGLFDEVLVVAMQNDGKRYLFTPPERLALMQETLSHLSNVRCDVWDGMLVDYAAQQGICAIVKGVRGEQDAAYELAQARFNKARLPGCETLLLPASEGLGDVSSTRVKALFAEGKDVTALAPKAVQDALKAKEAELVPPTGDKLR